MMIFMNFVHQRAGYSTQSTRRIVAYGQVPSIRNLTTDRQCGITVREHGPPVTAENYPHRHVVPTRTPRGAHNHDTPRNVYPEWAVCLWDNQRPPVCRVSFLSGLDLVVRQAACWQVPYSAACLLVLHDSQRNSTFLPASR